MPGEGRPSGICRLEASCGDASVIKHVQLYSAGRQTQKRPPLAEVTREGMAEQGGARSRLARASPGLPGGRSSLRALPARAAHSRPARPRPACQRPRPRPGSPSRCYTSLRLGSPICEVGVAIPPPRRGHSLPLPTPGLPPDPASGSGAGVPSAHPLRASGPSAAGAGTASSAWAGGRARALRQRATMRLFRGLRRLACRKASLPCR